MDLALFWFWGPWLEVRPQHLEAAGCLTTESLGALGSECEHWSVFFDSVLVRLASVNHRAKLLAPVVYVSPAIQNHPLNHLLSHFTQGNTRLS